MITIKHVILFLICVLVVVFIGSVLYSSEHNLQAEILGKPYPTPTPNPCGEEARICSGGEIAVQVEPKCEFNNCPNNNDVSKIWAAKVSSVPNYRVYINNALNFSFEAPTDWEFVPQFEMSDDTSDFYLRSPKYECDKNHLLGPECTGSEVFFSTTTNETDKSSIGEWLFYDKNNKGINPDDYDEQKNILIGGVEALALKSVGKTTFDTYYFLKNGIVYYLHFISSEKDGSLNYQPVFDQVLSTFKFSQ